MTSRAGIVLESALQSPGVVGAALVDSTGEVIETAWLGEGDLASSGATAIELLGRWAVVGTALAMGPPKFLMIEREGSQTAITPAGPDATLMLSGTRSCGPGRFRVEARRAREALLKHDPRPPRLGAALRRRRLVTAIDSCARQMGAHPPRRPASPRARSSSSPRTRSTQSTNKPTNKRSHFLKQERPVMCMKDSRVQMVTGEF